MYRFASYEIVKDRSTLAAARVEALRRAGVLSGRGAGGSAWTASSHVWRRRAFVWRVAPLEL